MKNSIDLDLEIYRLKGSFPKEELFCLAIRLRRAEISVLSDISEGAAGNQKKGVIGFLRISAGNLAEIETQAVIARRLNPCKRIPRCLRRG